MFPAEAMGKGGNISNQAEMIKPGFRRKGETFRKYRGFRSSEMLGGEVNDRMGGIVIGVGRGGLKFGGMRGCGKPENRGVKGTVCKKEWRTRGNRLKEKEPFCWRKLTERSESFRRWVAE